MCREGVNLGFLDKGASSENPGLVFKSGLDLQNLEPSFLLPSKSTGINRAQCQAILCDLFAATVPSLVPLTLVSLSFFITHHGLLTGPLSPLNVAASQERKTLSFSFTFSAPILLPVPPSPTLLTYHLRHVLFLAKAVSSGTWLWMWLPLCPQSSVGLWVCHPPPPCPDLLICKVDDSTNHVLVSIQWGRTRKGLWTTWDTYYPLLPWS